MMIEYRKNKRKQNEDERGITLVALVITMVILTILVAVTIITLEHWQMIKYAVEGTEKYTKEQMREEEEVKKLENTVEGALENIKNGNTGGEISKPKSKIKVVCNIEEKTAIIYSEDTEEYQIEWQINGEEEDKWNKEEKGIKEVKVTGLEMRDYISVRLTKGGNIKEAKKCYLDQEKPQLASVKLNKLSPTSSIIGPAVKATVTQIDNESGIDINKCKWIYSKKETEIGTEEEKYTGKFDNSEERIETEIKEDGRYYLHVLSIDNAGNKTETISEPIDVRQTINLYNRGEQYEEITGGWDVDIEGTNSAIGKGGFKLTFNADNINMKAGSGWNCGLVSTVNFLDYTSFNKYCYEIDNSYKNDFSYCWNCVAVYPIRTFILEST